MPNFEQPIVVASLAALKDIHVAELDDGTLAYVQALTSFYVLEKSNGGVDNGVTIIAPNAGSPIAGAAGARWVFLVLAGAEALVTPFQFIPVPTATTTGPGAVAFMTVPVNVLVQGAIEVEFMASVEVEVIAVSANFQGAALGFLWDGALIPPVAPSVVPQNAFMEFDASGVDNDPDTFSNGMTLRDVIPASLATVGPHVLTVTFEGLAAESKVDVFDGSGNLTIQTAPR